MEEAASRKKVEWLTLLLSIATLAGLVLLYVFVDAEAQQGHALTRLASGVLPNLIASLVVVLAAYWFLQRKAIPTLAAIAKETSSAKAESTQPTQGVKAFYEKFGQVPWPKLISLASSIDIVTWYFDSWIRNHRDDLRAFFQRGGHIRLVLPDPRVGSIVDLTMERYPELDKDDARKKIANTGIRLHELAAESGSKIARVEVVLCRRILSYSSVRFGADSVLLSVFDQFRSGQVDSPAILLDLRKSDSLRAYWDKEIGGFFQHGEVVRLSDLRSIYAGK